MSILAKYLTREILKNFSIVLVAAVGIYLSVDFFENVDKFVNAGLRMGKIVEFMELKLPLIISQIMPVGILLSVVITFGMMNKNNEIIALKSSGMRIYYVLKPVLLIGLVSSVLLFFISEVLVPITISRANQIWRVEVKKYTVASVQKNIWVKGHRSISYVAYFNPRKKTISGVTLNFFDSEFRLLRRVDAARGDYRRGKWIFFDVMEQVRDPETGAYDVRLYDQQVENFDLKPQELQRVVKKSEEMSFQELYGYIRNIEFEGYDATPYRVDLYAKFALPMSCLIVCLLATGITLKQRSREGLSLSIAYSMGVMFLYWVAYSFCMSLGYGGMLPAFIAAWTANFIFACLALFYLINVE